MIDAISLFSSLQDATSETTTSILGVQEIHQTKHYIILLATKHIMSLWHFGFIIVRSVRCASDLVNDKWWKLSFPLNEIIRNSKVNHPCLILDSLCTLYGVKSDVQKIRIYAIDQDLH